MEALPSMAAEVSAPLSQCDKVLFLPTIRIISWTGDFSKPLSLTGDNGDRPCWGPGQEHIRTCQVDRGGDGDHVQVSPSFRIRLTWKSQQQKSWLKWQVSTFRLGWCFANETVSYFESLANKVCGFFAGNKLEDFLRTTPSEATKGNSQTFNSWKKSLKLVKMVWYVQHNDRNGLERLQRLDNNGFCARVIISNVCR